MVQSSTCDLPRDLRLFFGTRRIEKLGCVFLFFVLVFLSTQVARAGDGDLDPTFGSSGKVITDFSARNDIAQAVAIQPDGKIVVVGQSGVDTVFHSALARYNPDGSLDATFGASGKVLVTLDAAGDLLSAVAILPSGKIIAAGALNQNNANVGFVVARFNANGSLDTSFGNAGRTITTFGDPAAQANALIVQSDGKIVLIGHSGAGPYSELNDFALVRYDSEGSLDSSFGNGGKVRTHFDGEFNTGSRAMDAILQADGKIIAVGHYKNEGARRRFALARYLPNGDLDSTFGAGGMVTTQLGDFDAYGMTGVLMANGKIAVGGFKDARRNNDFALARYNADGSLDSTFGGTGSIINDLFGSSDDVVYSLLALPDGKLVATGHTGDYPNFRFGLARYNQNGVFDLSFGTAGKVLTDFGGISSRSFASALQSDGKIVLAGYSVAALGSPDLSNNFAVARYVASAALTRAPFDFDGDHKTDIGVFRPAGGEWWINRSSNGVTTVTQFGASADTLAPADYTGDGKTDISFWRPSTGEWYVLRSDDNTFYSYLFGTTGDTPAPADYDADGKADAAVFRPSSGSWFIQRSSGGTTIEHFGSPGDVPVAADYDGDGRTDLAIYRPANGQWWINRSTGSVIAFAFGNSSDRPVIGDYTGDGKIDAAFWRPSTGEWYVLRSENFSYYAVPFGVSTDTPAPGDYDGDGKSDPAVFRSGTWYVARSTAGTQITQFGTSGDRPIASAFIP